MRLAMMHVERADDFSAAHQGNGDQGLVSVFDESGEELEAGIGEGSAGESDGSESVLPVLCGLGVKTTRRIANRMLPQIRRRAVLKKSCLSHQELVQIFHLSPDEAGGAELQRERSAAG